MKQFVLTVYIPDNNVRDSVHVAQMLREAAATVEYQIPMETTSTSTAPPVPISMNGPRGTPARSTARGTSAPDTSFVCSPR